MNGKEQIDWCPLSGEIIYDNRWIRVIRTEVARPDKSLRHEYTIVHFKNLAIGIIPITEDKHTYIVGQYRYPICRYSWEIPEGGGSIYIPPLVSAQRELKEETGLMAKRWTKILEMHLSNSATDEKAIIYVAGDLEEGISQPEMDEIITIKKIPLKDLYRMVLNGEITDSLTVAGVLKLYILDREGWLDSWLLKKIDS